VGQVHGAWPGSHRRVDIEKRGIEMSLFVVRAWLQARFTKSERGASMVEYILLVALIALAVISAVLFLGTQLNSGFNNAGSKVSQLPNP
jgi:pilus assembly protein Flp/PilA